MSAKIIFFKSETIKFIFSCLTNTILIDKRIAKVIDFVYLMADGL